MDKKTRVGIAIKLVIAFLTAFPIEEWLQKNTSLPPLSDFFVNYLIISLGLFSIFILYIQRDVFKRSIYFYTLIFLSSISIIIFSISSLKTSDQIEILSNNIASLSYQIQGLQSQKTTLSLDATEFSSKNDVANLLIGLTNTSLFNLQNPSNLQNYFYSYLQLEAELGLISPLNASTTAQALQRIQNGADYHENVDVSILDKSNVAEEEIEQNIETLEGEQSVDSQKQNTLNTHNAFLIKSTIGLQFINILFALIAVIVEEYQRDNTGEKKWWRNKWVFISTIIFIGLVIIGISYFLAL